jgi:hypothetical protein
MCARIHRPTHYTGELPDPCSRSLYLGMPDTACSQTYTLIGIQNRPTSVRNTSFAIQRGIQSSVADAALSLDHTVPMLAPNGHGFILVYPW